jgi:hypothetical protein
MADELTLGLSPAQLAAVLIGEPIDEDETRSNRLGAALRWSRNHKEWNRIPI